jgi:hypothetical protein
MDDLNWLLNSWRLPLPVWRIIRSPEVVNGTDTIMKRKKGTLGLGFQMLPRFAIHWHNKIMISLPEMRTVFVRFPLCGDVSKLAPAKGRLSSIPSFREARAQRCVSLIGHDFERNAAKTCHPATTALPRPDGAG